MAYGVLPRVSQHLLNGFEKECGSRLSVYVYVLQREAVFHQGGKLHL